MSEEPFDRPFPAHETSFVVEKKLHADHLYLLDLIKVLTPHPAGLRRWSIMRTIRKNRELAQLPISQKMEDAVERVFRNHCADSEYFKKQDKAPEKALFHWPQGKAGGLWAVYPEKATAWLEAEGAENWI